MGLNKKIHTQTEVTRLSNDREGDALQGAESLVTS